MATNSRTRPLSSATPQLPGKNNVISSCRFYTKVALRFLRLQIFSLKAVLNSSTEQPKVAIYRDRKAAVLHALVHLLPMLGAVTLIILNVHTYYIGTVSPTTLTALQFAAKLLEVLIQGSLAAALLGVIRREAIGDHGIPLGSLLAPLHVADVSWFWSLDFWGSAISRARQSWQKVWLLTVIVTAITLAAVAGPSSAVLMLPRPIHYLVEKDLVLLDDDATIFPRTLDGNSFIDEPSLRQAFSQFWHFGTDFSWPGKPQQFIVTDQFGIRNVITVTDYDAGEFVSTIATVPSSSAALSLNLEGSVSQDQSVETRFSQPYARKFEAYTKYAQAIQFNPSPNDPVLWLSPSRSRHISVVAVFALSPCLECIPPITAWNAPRDEEVSMVGCTVEAVWAKTDLSATVNGEVTSTNAQSTCANERIWHDQRNSISISPAWARKIYEIFRSSPTNYQRFEEYGALVVAFGLANIVPNPLSLDVYSDLVGLETFLNQSGLSRKYSEVSLSVTKNFTDPSTLTPLEWRGFYDGYGYDTSTVTVQLSLMVLGIYCVATVMYLMWTFVTGETGHSWDSGGELLLLGMNSHSPGHLGYTSAGAETLKTFGEPVNVRVNDTGSLELVFANNSTLKNTVYRKVVANERY